MSLLVVFVLALALAVVATRAAIPYLSRVGAVAHENDRTMHRGSVPKGGGAPVLIAAGIALIAAGNITETTPSWLVVGSATLILAGLSWLDDLRQLPAAIRLTVHLAVASAFVLSFPAHTAFFQGWLPTWLDSAVAIVGLAWLMNLYNFMDGINGIAGTETLAISFGYLAIAAASGSGVAYAPIAAAVAGATAGFLVWNARTKPLVFMGDVGSIPLGFLMGALMLDLAARGYWAPAIILPAYYLTDATLTLFLRALRGEKVWHAHRSHSYQRAATGIGAHLPVVVRIAIANALLIGAALLSFRSLSAALTASAAVVAGLMINLELSARTRSSDSDRSRP